MRTIWFVTVVDLNCFKNNKNKNNENNDKKLQKNHNEIKK